MTDEKRNIVLVTIDSLRADHCGYYGYDGDTTPTLDKMAADGTTFETAIAPGPATPESMPVMFTGQWPVDRADDETGSQLEQRRERIRNHMEARDSLPEQLQRLGYETAAFTPNPFTSRHFGFDDGFDHFQDFMDESDRGSLYKSVFQGFLKESGISSMARVFMNFWQGEEVFKPWESYYDEVIEWVEQASEPYFLWVFLMDAHNPYMSSSEQRTQSKLQEFHANFEFWRQSHETPFSDSIHERLVTAYDDSIRYSDAFLRRLRADIADDNPVIAVHGDHGEAFGEHGTYGHEPYLHEENVHVPLVIEGINEEDVKGPVSLRDLPSGLRSLTAGDTAGFESDGPVVSYTRDGDALAVYTPKDVFHFTRVDGDWEPADNTEVPETVQYFADRHQADATERHAVVKSGRHLTGDTSL